jgi:hypothetical protein
MDGEEEEKTPERKQRRKRDLCLNILLILKRMVEHNAVIYVYCDFNLKLLHPTTSPSDRLHVERCSGMIEGMHAMCNGLCTAADSNNKIDESIRYHEEN